MEQTLINALEQGATVITANRRLTRHLATCYAAHQQASGANVWETPDVLPWPAWIARSWESWFDAARDTDKPAPALLAPEQEQALWERVIQDCERDDPRFDARAAAGLALDAWRLWRAWRLPLERVQSACASDTQVFLKWAAAFESRCRAERVIDAARSADVIVEWLVAGRLVAPSRLVLVGFDELTPQQHAVFDALRGRDCEIAIMAPEARPSGRAARIGASDAEQEIWLAAGWARARLEQNPSARIGIVDLNLSQRRDSVERILEDVLHPNAVRPGVHSGPRAYDISLGRALKLYPVVHTALDVLELSGDSIPLTRAGNLLRSPFLKSGEAEQSRRGLLDAKLRDTGEMNINRRTLAWHARARDKNGNPRRYACPILAAMLAAFERVLQTLPARQSPAKWAPSFARLLQSLGWPGERMLNSEETQTVEAWRRALHALAGLERLNSSISLAEALNFLRQIAASIFQPESSDAPIQVMGMLEASGATFDCLWLMGLHDEAWPAPAQPNPLLPIALQRAHGVPHASAERELEYARNVTARLFASAPEIVASYPTREGDRDLSPSPLIANLEEARREQLFAAAGENWSALIYRSAAIETLSDDSAPPLTIGEQMSGGVRLLEDQAACPFRAFATHRLGARALNEPGLGLDPTARGSLVHIALERLWSELQTHERLCGLEDDALRAAVKIVAAAAIDELARGQSARAAARFFAIEQERLESLLMAWMALEKRRAPFRVVAREAPRTLNIGELRLETRVDRIDELVDGGQRVMIDYKTGKPGEPAWFDSRLEQPQLPLYSVYDDGDEKPAAVLLAYLRPGAVQHRGIAAREGLAPELTAFLDTRIGKNYGSWQAIFESWKTALESLAGEIMAGRAAVDPKDKRRFKTCEFCELPLLCRMNEIFADVGATPDADAEDA